jgi:DNA-binding response OmpR family regulator
MIASRADPPDILLIGAGWRPRALLRAQLIEEGFEVLATDDWSTARRYLRPGRKPRLVIADLQGLPEPDRALSELRVLMKPDRVLVIAAAGTVPNAEIEALGFRVVKRPISIGKIVEAAAAAAFSSARQRGARK